MLEGTSQKIGACPAEMGVAQFFHSKIFEVRCQT